MHLIGGESSSVSEEETSFLVSTMGALPLQMSHSVLLCRYTTGSDNPVYLHWIRRVIDV